jgi:D-alanyl-D-alanine dipeptidase
MSARAWPLRRIWLVAMLVGCVAPIEARTDGLGNGFAFLDQIDPTIIQDMRYAGSNNFTGQPLPGYRSARCVVMSAVGAALKQVQADLAASHLSLKVFDCYRPIRAVQAMVRWVGDRKIGGDKNYFPRTEKAALIHQQYIASRSGHSTGTVLDLTLVDLSVSSDDVQAPGRNGPCTAENHSRAPNEVDMGTSFDCFDPKSATASAEITRQQRQNRATLVTSMRRHGFSNYQREWWHFSFSSGSTGAFDFEIPANPAPAPTSPPPGKQPSKGAD